MTPEERTPVRAVQIGPQEVLPRSPSRAREPDRLTAFAEFVVKTYRTNWHQLSYQRQEEFLRWAMQNRAPNGGVTRRQRRA